MEHSLIHAHLTNLQASYSFAVAAEDPLKAADCFLPGECLPLSAAAGIHLFHSPHLLISADGRSAQVTWESYGYTADRSESAMMTTRFAAEAVFTADGWRYRNADWVVMQKFEPLPFSAEQDSICHPPVPIPDGPLPDAHSCRVLRNLAGILCANNWRDCESLFAPSACADLEGLTDGCIPAEAWLRETADCEAHAGGRYRCLPILGPGYICSESSDRARGLWLCQVFEVKQENGAQVIQRRICSLDLQFIRSERWRISSLTLRTVQALSDIPGAGTRYERMTFPESNWLYTSFEPDTPCEDSALAVENIFALWPVSVHRGNLMRFFRHYLCQPDTVLSIRSQGPQTPPKTGPEEISGKLTPMDASFRPPHLTYHCATTPVIQQMEPDVIRASWIDHSLTNLGPRSDGSAGYMVFVTRYDHVFRRIRGHWYLTEFNWEPCLGFPDESFVSLPGAGQGWAASHPDQLYPLPLGLNDYE
ncbi:MAG: hypothetical protein J6P31_04555 [Oscillospiraceae bacterium]|nr:hypothetical protein [Oscillospiraceae bacterium]